MKEDSTQRMNGPEDKKKKIMHVKRTTPRKQTLDFLSQLARVYHSEPALSPEFCGLIIN